MNAFWTILRLACAGTLVAGAMTMTSDANADNTSSAKEMAQKNQWVQQCLLDAKAQPPFSFAYGEGKSADLLAGWQRKTEIKKLDVARTQHVLTWADPKTGLEVRCVAVEYGDFPTVEWTLYFRNNGKEDTPILSGVQALDTMVAGSKFLLHHNRGTHVKADDFEPFTTDLQTTRSLTLTTAQGRPCAAVWPYFNLQDAEGGRIIVVGWPGKWSATFDNPENGRGTRVTAGQELVHLKLHPGEEIRTPLMVQQFYQGDWLRAQNIWRRWMLAHNLPRLNGELPKPILTPCSSHQFAEMTKADEACQTHFIDRYLEEGINIDFWWMDAGWYPCKGQWWNTGTWEVDKTRFPRGLRAISDHAHKKGVKIIVWFEPERVQPDSWLYDNHKEDWLLDGTLLNLGNPEALDWVINHIDKIIVDEGIDLYRQDYNIDPLPYWRKNDAPDRQGITEIKYVTGYLAYWDELRRRHPGMLIDSCASGGHRNDLETMRRSVPMLRSDYIFEPVGQQGHTYGLAYWLPFFGTGPEPKAVDHYTYVFRSVMCAGMIPGWDMRDKTLDYALLRKLTTQWRSIAPLYFGDYYPLTPYSLGEATWIAWQFNRPEEGDGMVQAFRRDKNEEASKTFRLSGLDPKARYEIRNLDSETPERASGKDLMDKGLTVTIGEKPGAAVLTYKRVK
jgi:alpha-galactosidase